MLPAEYKSHVVLRPANFSLLQADMSTTAIRGTGVFLPGFSGRAMPLCSTTAPKLSHNTASLSQPISAATPAEDDFGNLNDLAENPPSREGSCNSLHSYERRDQSYQGDGIFNSSSSCSSRPGSSCDEVPSSGAYSQQQQQQQRPPFHKSSSTRDQSKPSRKGIFSEAQLLQEFGAHQPAADVAPAAAAPAAVRAAPAATGSPSGPLPHPPTPPSAASAAAAAGGSVYHIPMQPAPSSLQYFSPAFLELWNQSNNGCNCSACVQCRHQIHVAMEAAAAAAAALQSVAGRHHPGYGFGMQATHGAMPHMHQMEQQGGLQLLDLVGRSAGACGSCHAWQLLQLQCLHVFVCILHTPDYALPDVG